MGRFSRGTEVRFLGKPGLLADSVLEESQNAHGEQYLNLNQPTIQVLIWGTINYCGALGYNLVIIMDSAKKESSKKTVLMVQQSKHQSQIWQGALNSQGVSVIWESPSIDLMEMLNQMNKQGLKTPDLLLIDLASQSNSPYAFCRWCREHYPDIKIVLTNSTQKQISTPEYDWAISQGAHALLPGFQRQTLLTGVTLAVSRVLRLLDLSLSRQEALVQMLFSLISSQPTASAPTNGTESIAPAPTPEPDPPEPNPAPDPKNNPLKLRYRGQAYD